MLIIIASLRHTFLYACVFVSVARPLVRCPQRQTFGTRDVYDRSYPVRRKCSRISISEARVQGPFAQGSLVCAKYFCYLPRIGRWVCTLRKLSTCLVQRIGEHHFHLVPHPHNFTTNFCLSLEPPTVARAISSGSLRAHLPILRAFFTADFRQMAPQSAAGPPSTPLVPVLSRPIRYVDAETILLWRQGMWKLMSPGADISCRWPLMREPHVLSLIQAGQKEGGH